MLRKVVLILYVLCCTNGLFAQQQSWQKELKKINNKVGQFEWLFEHIKDYKAEEPYILEKIELLAGELRIDSITGKSHMAIGRYYTGAGQLAEGWHEFDLAKAAFLRSRNYNGAVKTLINQCTVLMMQRLGDSMVRFIDKNQSLIRLSDPHWQLGIQLTKANGYSTADRMDEALSAYQQALPEALRQKDTAVLLSLYMNLGRMYNGTDSAMYWFSKALPLTKNNLEKYTELMQKIGVHYILMDNDLRDSSLFYFLEAEKNIDAMKNVVNKSQLENMLGDYFFSKGEPQTALSYFRKAYAYVQVMGGVGQGSILPHNMAICFIALKQADSARYYLDIYKERLFADYDHMLYHQANARYLSMKGDSCAYGALEEFIEALPYARKSNETKVAIDIFSQTMNCFIESAADPRMKKLAERLLVQCSFYQPLIKSTNHLFDYATFLSRYAKVESRYGNPQKALLLYDELTGVFAEIQTSKHNLGRNEMYVKYKTELKDAEIALAAEKNTRLMLVAAFLLLMILVIIFAFWKTRTLNKQVIAQKNELQNLNGVKDRLFSVISHDMQTPVHSLIAFGRLLENGNVPAEKMSGYVTELNSTLGATSSLMSNLLNWAHTQMKGYKPVMRTVLLSGHAGNMIQLVSPEAKRKGITLRQEIDPEIRVITDSNMLELIIRNLLNNAIKFTPDHGTVTLSAKQLNGMVALLVSDTGVGMEQDTMNEFNMNVQNELMESTRGTANESGSGMGLWLCKNFVSLLGGRISVESQLDKGSVFTVELKA